MAFTIGPVRNTGFRIRPPSSPDARQATFDRMVREGDGYVGGASISAFFTQPRNASGWIPS